MSGKEFPQHWGDDFEEAYKAFEKNWWWFTGRRDLVSRLYRERIGSQARVLELGCGSGINGRIFPECIEYCGVDISFQLLKHGRAQGVEGLCLSTLNSLPFASNAFDLVLLLDVLEHLDDEGPALKETHRVLTEGGAILVLAPAHMFLWGSHDIVNSHKRRYAKEQLRSLLASHGFVIDWLSYWNFFAFPPTLVKRRLDRILGMRRPRGDFRELPGLLNALLDKMLRIENSLIARRLSLPVGISLLAICRKEKAGKS